MSGRGEHSASFKWDDHDRCSRHADFLSPDYLCDPAVCEICQALVDAISLNPSLDKTSTEYCWQKHHWTSVQNMLSHKKHPIHWVDESLWAKLGFNSSKDGGVLAFNSLSPAGSGCAQEMITPLTGAFSREPLALTTVYQGEVVPSTSSAPAGLQVLHLPVHHLPPPPPGCNALPPPNSSSLAALFTEFRDINQCLPPVSASRSRFLLPPPQHQFW